MIIWNYTEYIHNRNSSIQRNDRRKSSKLISRHYEQQTSEFFYNKIKREIEKVIKLPSEEKLFPNILENSKYPINFL